MGEVLVLLLPVTGVAGKRGSDVIVSGSLVVTAG